MWFCPNDNSCCVLGDVHDSVKGKLQVPKLWPIFTGTRLIQMKVASLEEVGFACLGVPLWRIMVGIQMHLSIKTLFHKSICPNLLNQ